MHVVAEQPLVGLSVLAEAASLADASERTLDAAAFDAVESAPALEEATRAPEDVGRARETAAPVAEAVEGVGASPPEGPSRTAPSSVGALRRNLLGALAALLAVVLFFVIYVSRKAARERL
jgi:hypothetical protein